MPTYHQPNHRGSAMSGEWRSLKLGEGGGARGGGAGRFGGNELRRERGAWVKAYKTWSFTGTNWKLRIWNAGHTL